LSMALLCWLCTRFFVFVVISAANAFVLLLLPPCTMTPFRMCHASRSFFDSRQKCRSDRLGLVPFAGFGFGGNCGRLRLDPVSNVRNTLPTCLPAHAISHLLF
jgi:hypothetical protein